MAPPPPPLLVGGTPPRQQRRWLPFALIGLVAVVVLVGVLISRQLLSPTTGTPSIYRPASYLWNTDPQKQTLLVPTTDGNPGTRISLTLFHERGFGQALKGTDLYSTAVSQGNQVMNDAISHLQSNGWKLLFSPAAAGSFPTYEFYTTLQSGSAYCFIVYSAARLDQPQGVQIFDIYHT